MKAIKFIMAMGAICNHYSENKLIPCADKKGNLCPLHDMKCEITQELTEAESIKLQAAVEDWLKGHIKTNGEKFSETFGMNAGDFWALCDVNAEKWINQRYEEEEENGE